MEKQGIAKLSSFAGTMKYKALGLPNFICTYAVRHCSGNKPL